MTYRRFIVRIGSVSLASLREDQRLVQLINMSHLSDTQVIRRVRNSRVTLQRIKALVDNGLPIT